MPKLVLNLDVDPAEVSPEVASLLGVIMSAISDAVAGVAEAADGAVARANKKIEELQAEVDQLKADAATPEDVNKLQGTKTVLDGLAPDSAVVVNPPETPPGPSPVA